MAPVGQPSLLVRTVDIPGGAERRIDGCAGRWATGTSPTPSGASVATICSATAQWPSPMTPAIWLASLAPTHASSRTERHAGHVLDNDPRAVDSLPPRNRRGVLTSHRNAGSSVSGASVGSTPSRQSAKQRSHSRRRDRARRRRQVAWQSRSSKAQELVAKTNAWFYWPRRKRPILAGFEAPRDSYKLATRTPKNGLQDTFGATKKVLATL